jgi:hypothetical protein
MYIHCMNNPMVSVYLDADQEDMAGSEPWPADVYEFIGLALHAVQQGQAYDLAINGYVVRAILMDQTCGVVWPDDIFHVSHPSHERRYQRLNNILNNTFEI